MLKPKLSAGYGQKKYMKMLTVTMQSLFIFLCAFHRKNGYPSDSTMVVAILTFFNHILEKFSGCLWYMIWNYFLNQTISVKLGLQLIWKPSWVKLYIWRLSLRSLLKWEAITHFDGDMYLWKRLLPAVKKVSSICVYILPE